MIINNKKCSTLQLKRERERERERERVDIYIFIIIFTFDILWHSAAYVSKNGQSLTFSPFLKVLSLKLDIKSVLLKVS